MSFLIKGMDMPKSCKDCNIKRDISGWYSCALEVKYGKPLNLENIYDELIYIDSRHPDCPFDEIPTSHGRLIDADEVKENQWIVLIVFAKLLISMLKSKQLKKPYKAHCS